MKYNKDKEPVRLRFRALANGNQSIYLDIYVRGMRRYEFLKLYLIPERNAGDRQRNAQTMAFAQAIKAQRIVDLQASAHGLVAPNSSGRIPIVEFLQETQQMFRDKGSVSRAVQIGSLIRHIEEFGAGHSRLQDVDRRFVEDFIVYLRHPHRVGGAVLRESSQRSYFNMFNAILSRAVSAGLIAKNPAHEVGATDRPQSRCRQRSFLTMQEVQRLVDTPCPHEGVKRAFLFSCFCGLRYSDVVTLRWQNIRTASDGRLQVEIIQTKTQEPVYLPLSDNAVGELPPRGKPGDRLFALPTRTYLGKVLKKWVAAAGIDKPVTFHVARHTYATLLLTFGADLYTVSKLLGHTDVKTTQIYAKVVDEKKRAAVDLVPKI